MVKSTCRCHVTYILAYYSYIILFLKSLCRELISLPCMILDDHTYYICRNQMVTTIRSWRIVSQATPLGMYALFVSVCPSIYIGYVQHTLIALYSGQAIKCLCMRVNQANSYALLNLAFSDTLKHE